jgi:HSP20 family protein
MTTVIWKAGTGSDRPEKRRMLIETFGWQVRLQSHTWNPPTDLYETEDVYVVRVEVAGMRQQDFSVTLENNFLIVSGTRSETHERRAYQQMEIRFGEFSSVVAIPAPVDAENATAEYEDGFLIVTLPRSMPNKINIQKG